MSAPHPAPPDVSRNWIEGIASAQRFDVVLCYLGCGLFPILFLWTRKGEEREHRVVRFHAVQALILVALLALFSLALASLGLSVTVLRSLGPSVIGLLSLGVIVLGLLAAFGVAVRLPFIAGLAEWASRYRIGEGEVSPGYVTPKSALRSSGTALAIMGLIAGGVFFTQPLGALVVSAARVRDFGDPLLLLVLLGGIASFSVGTVLSHRTDAARMGSGDAAKRRPDAVEAVCAIVLIQFVCAGILSVARLFYAHAHGATMEALIPQGLSLLGCILFVCAAIGLLRGRGWAYWWILVGEGVLTFVGLIELAVSHREVMLATAELYGRIAVVLYLAIIYCLTKPSVRWWVFNSEHMQSR